MLPVQHSPFLYHIRPHRVSVHHLDGHLGCYILLCYNNTHFSALIWVQGPAVKGKSRFESLFVQGEGVLTGTERAVGSAH